MELFDILNRDGKPTGLTAEKGAPLQTGQYYLGIHVYIYNSSGDFLLQQRAYDKTFLPGGWDVVLEHAIAGETSHKCAIRGIAEEIGLAVSENDINFAGRVVWDEYHHIVDIYFAKLDFAIDELNLQPSEVIGVKTVSKEEMLTLVSNMYYRPDEYHQLVICEINKH